MSCFNNLRTPQSYWRVFYTQPRTEKKCESRLRDQQIDVLLPIYSVIRQWKDRRKKVIEPLFRNYIFAYVTESERIKVLQTPGIVRCISFGGSFARLTEEEIQQIKLIQLHPERIERMDSPPKLLGKKVLIDSGSMRGLKGEVIETRGETRLMIRVTSLNMAIKVEVPYSFTKTA